jgi:hypothetical protein
MTQPGDGERRGMEKAMPTSVAKLHGQAQRLVDELGPNVAPPASDPLAREYRFSQDAIVRAGFEPGAEVWLTDTLGGEGDEDDEFDEPLPPQVTLFYRYQDEQIFRTRDTSLELLVDGRIVATEPIEILRHQGRQAPQTDRELAERIAAHMLPPTGPNVFSQAECDQWLNLIKYELELYGR